MFDDVDRHADIVWRLWNALHEHFGAASRFEISEKKHGGYVLAYSGDGISMGEVRDVVDHTVPFGIGVLLNDRDSVNRDPIFGKPLA